MTDALITAGLAVLSYFLGNISPSIIQGKRAGIDIKKEGSGNAGTTNTLRVLGKKAALITLTVDILKGVAAVLLGRYLSGETTAMLCGLLVFCGHIWPAAYGFRGGKGVATAFGVIVTVEPLLGLSVLGIVAVVVLLTRMVSAGAVTGALAFPFLANAFDPDYLWWALVMALIVLYRHNENIRRIMKGEESRLRFKKREEEA